MTVRTEGLNRFIAVAALATLPLMLSGCTERPNAHLDWDSPTISEKQAQAKPKPVAKPKPRPSYAQTRPYCSCDEDRYAARPADTSRPAWYTPSPRPNYREDRTETADARFSWPVRGGRVIAEFGSNTGGERNDGINIAASEGTPIYAAGDGVVSYSGDELKSYGNLALVRHSNGYVSAYAHADRFVVYKGDRVVRGQVIGYVGATGDVTRPQLHFEIRRGARGETPVNPRNYLIQSQVASRY